MGMFLNGEGGDGNDEIQQQSRVFDDQLKPLAKVEDQQLQSQSTAFATATATAIAQVQAQMADLQDTLHIMVFDSPSADGPRRVVQSPSSIASASTHSTPLTPTPVVPPDTLPKTLIENS